MDSHRDRGVNPVGMKKGDLFGPKHRHAARR